MLAGAAARASEPANSIGVATIDAAVTSVAQRGVLVRERAGRDGGTEQHETELARLRQREREAQRAYCGACRAMRVEGKGDHRLDESRAAVASASSSGLRARQIQIGRHADGDEEEAQQQALERFDVGLQFMAVFGFR